MLLLIALVVVGVVAYRVTTAAERERLLHAGLAYGRRVRDTARREDPSWTPLLEALRERTRRPLVTRALGAVLLLLFVAAALDAGALADPDALLDWGASSGLRTTQGEWWRLASSLFIHTGVLALAINVIGLLPAGLLMERLLGHAAFAAVYLAAGVLAGLAGLAVDPMGVTAGASGAIFGVYGLLLVWSIDGLFARSAVTLPLGLAARVAPLAVVFVLYNVFARSVPLVSELSGLLVGMVAGTVLVKGAAERKPPPRRIAVTAGAALAMAILAAIPLRGLVDVRPVVAEIVAADAAAAQAYRTDVQLYRTGRIGETVLVALIDETLLPGVRVSRDRLEALGRVPQQDEWLVSATTRFLGLREQSWRIRADGLRQRSLRLLEEADAADREALVALGSVNDALRTPARAPRAADESRAP